MLQIHEVKVTGTNHKVTTGAFTGDIQTHILEGGAQHIYALAKTPPEGVHVVAIDWSELYVTVTFGISTPADLRSLADALEL